MNESTANNFLDRYFKCQGSKDFELLSSKFSSRTVATDFRFRVFHVLNLSPIGSFHIGALLIFNAFSSGGGKPKKKTANHTEEQLGKNLSNGGRLFFQNVSQLGKRRPSLSCLLTIQNPKFCYLEAP